MNKGWISTTRIRGMMQGLKRKRWLEFIGTAEKGAAKKKRDDPSSSGPLVMPG